MVHEIILQQLGGSKFTAMTGTTGFVYSDKSLSMKLTRNKSAATHLTITLQCDDLYSLHFFRVRGVKVSPVITWDDISDTSLQTVFTAVTGQDTHL